VATPKFCGKGLILWLGLKVYSSQKTVKIIKQHHAKAFTRSLTSLLDYLQLTKINA